MPIEATAVASGPTSATKGDRFEVGDLMGFIGSIEAAGANPALCSAAAGVALVMGAATLAAAGSLTLATALAI